MAGKDTNIGAKRAREVREELGIDAAAPIGCILSVVEEDLSLPVVVAALPEGVAGCCWRDGSRIVLWVNGLQPAVRQRFTLAHELGHVRCGHDAGVRVDTFETLSGRTSDSREVQANAFAAELLAPAAGVRELVVREPSLEDVVLLAARYGISTIAALFRLNTLGLTKRTALLQAELAQGLAEAIWDRVAPEVVEDLIAQIDPTALPRLSPSLRRSALAAVADGSSSVATAAASAGCDEDRLAAGAATIGV